ncbi:carboxypeptidase-like regulatory domain-containing protein, partial [Flavobacteriaceae bacterium]|nr:carboxypeptidase-like regulatory domain-containing protein [Flavobacteriaceae bacterium]
MKKILSIIFLLSFILTYSQVRFEGKVSDAFGNNIMGANVIAIEKESKILDGFGISSDTGYFRVSLKKGTDYEIKVSFIGFKEVVFDLNLTE